MSYWNSYYYRRRHDTTYDPNSPLEQYRRESREHINIALFDVDNRGTLPAPRTCPYHPEIPLVPKRDGSGSMICRECGEWKLEKLQPPEPQPAAKGKVRQKQTSQGKSFVQALPERRRKRKGTLGNPDETANLSNDEYDWIRGMWNGNITDGTGTDSG